MRRKLGVNSNITSHWRKEVRLLVRSGKMSQDKNREEQTG